VVALMLLAGALFTFGARWDELWHRMYGGFGDDFLWPPHLMLYGSLGLNGLFAGLGLSIALRGGRGQDGLRERFRAEPLMGLLGLLSAYQLASIPSDQLWHQIIGPDLTAWSLPHALLTLTSCGAWLAGAAIALSLAPRRGWRGLGGLQAAELAALVMIGLSLTFLLQFGTTEWEWPPARAGGAILALHRPAWSYPVVVLLIGVAGAHLALYATRRIGVATAVALGVLLVHLAIIALMRTLLPPGPVLASHLLLVAPAVALDAWHSWRRRHESPATLLGGAALYGLVYFAVALPYIARVMVVPVLDPASGGVAIAGGLPLVLLAGLIFARMGSWLGSLGAMRPQESPRPAAPAAALGAASD
jgi:hypothetical protein